MCCWTSGFGWLSIDSQRHPMLLLTKKVIEDKLSFCFPSVTHLLTHSITHSLIVTVLLTLLHSSQLVVMQPDMSKTIGNHVSPLPVPQPQAVVEKGMPYEASPIHPRWWGLVHWPAWCSSWYWQDMELCCWWGQDMFVKKWKTNRCIRLPWYTTPTNSYTTPRNTSALLMRNTISMLPITYLPLISSIYHHRCIRLPWYTTQHNTTPTNTFSLITNTYTTQHSQILTQHPQTLSL